MAKKLFKGTDRKLLLKVKQVLAGLVAREARAADPKPTKKLSTRTLMFGAVPIANPPQAPTYSWALDKVIARIQNDLDTTV